jgi:hypothetical protein
MMLLSSQESRIGKGTDQLLKVQSSQLGFKKRDAKATSKDQIADHQSRQDRNSSQTLSKRNS